MKNLLISLLALFATLAIAYGSSSTGDADVKGTVFYKNGEYTYQSGYDESGAAYGVLSNELTATGWSRLVIHTNKAFEDDVQAYAAGMLEGSITWDKIWVHRKNLFEWYFKHYLNASDFSPQIYAFLAANQQYVYENVKQHSATDPYWKVVGLTVAQFEGLVAGYNGHATSDKQIDKAHFWVYESAGDLLDLTEVLPSKADMKDWREAETPIDFTTEWTIRNRCSGLVKVTEGNGEIFMGQAAWFMMGAMNRILKTYDFPFAEAGVASKEMKFSSYPGLMFSWDDFYVMDTGVGAIETTFSIFNNSLYRHNLKTSCVFDWVRVMVANRMATSAESWCQAFSRENSGTYNNQWSVVDFNKFESGKPLKDGLLYVLEQVPGLCEYKDQTDLLRTQAYMPSYNTPHYPRILELSNYTETIKAQGPHGAFWIDPDNCCRAKIFRRDHTKVTDLESMKFMMRYNDWKNDPLSKDPVYGPDAGAGICSRYDLRAKDYPRAMAFGGLDSKIVSSELMKKNQFTAISGPTHATQPVFSFDTLEYWCPHEGLPDTYDFDWVVY